MCRYWSTACSACSIRPLVFKIADAVNQFKRNIPDIAERDGGFDAWACEAGPPDGGYRPRMRVASELPATCIHDRFPPSATQPGTRPATPPFTPRFLPSSGFESV